MGGKKRRPENLSNPKPGARVEIDKKKRGWWEIKNGGRKSKKQVATENRRASERTLPIVP